MSENESDKKLAVEEIAESFFGRLKEVFVEALEDVAKVVAGKKEEPAPAGTKLGLVKGTGTDGKTDPEAKTEPPPAEPTTSQRTRVLRPV